MERILEAVSQQHDEAYYKADKLLKAHNPCQIQSHECGGVTCVNPFYSNKPEQVCCLGCAHHSHDGCTVLCLCCKTALCANSGSKWLRDELLNIRRGLVFYSYLSTLREPKEKGLRHLASELQAVYRSNILWNVLNAKEM